MTGPRKRKAKAAPAQRPTIEFSDEKAIELLLAGGFTEAEIDDPAALRRFACRQSVDAAQAAHEHWKTLQLWRLSLLDWDLMFLDLQRADLAVIKANRQLLKTKRQLSDESGMRLIISVKHDLMAIDLDLARGLITKLGARQQREALYARLKEFVDLTEQSAAKIRAKTDTPAKPDSAKDRAAQRRTMRKVEQQLRAKPMPAPPVVEQPEGES